MSDDARPLSHVDDRGRARMVDVTGKSVTLRRAVARCVVRGNRTALEALATDDEDVVALSRAAGILAARRASQLIPLCHPLPVDDVTIRIELARESVDITAEATVVARTGVEMEALTACGVAGLAIAMTLLRTDPEARVDTLSLWEKSGGRSGTWRRDVGLEGTDLDHEGADLDHEGADLDHEGAGGASRAPPAV